MTHSTDHIDNPDCISQEDMIAYINGTLSNTEMHRIETHTLMCDMCNDELEGLQLLNNPSDITAITEDLQKQILATTRQTPRIPLWKKISAVAAVIVCVAGIGILTKHLLLPIDSFIVAEHIQENASDIHAEKEQIKTDVEEPSPEIPQTEDRSIEVPPIVASPEERIMLNEKPMIVESDIIEIAEDSFFFEDASEVIDKSSMLLRGYTVQADQEREMKFDVEMEHPPIEPIRSVGYAVSKNEVRAAKLADAKPEIQKTVFIVNNTDVGYSYFGKPEFISGISRITKQEDIANYSSKPAQQALVITTEYTPSNFVPAQYRAEEQEIEAAILAHISKENKTAVVGGVIRIYCSISIHGKLSVLYLDMPQNSHLEQELLTFLGNTQWNPATQNNKTVESFYIFTVRVK